MSKKWSYITIPPQRDYAEQYALMRQAYADRRGSDGQIPRTTNQDVRQIGHYWMKEVVANQEQLNRSSQRSQEKRWWREYNLSLLRADRTKPHGRYSHNAEFWDATRGISLQLSGTQANPDKAELLVEMAEETLDDVKDVVFAGALGLLPNITKLIPDNALDPLIDPFMRKVKMGLLIAGGTLGAILIVPPTYRYLANSQNRGKQ